MMSITGTCCFCVQGKSGNRGMQKLQSFHTC